MEEIKIKLSKEATIYVKATAAEFNLSINEVVERCLITTCQMSEMKPEDQKIVTAVLMTYDVFK